MIRMSANNTPAPAYHVAILRRVYINMILRGEKTVESRLTIRLLPPYGVIAPGDRIYLKISSGPYAATAIATKVVFYQDLTAQRVEQLRRRYQKRVGGDDAYWSSKATARYATFITLGDVRPAKVGPPIRSSGLAWFVVRQWPAAAGDGNDKGNGKGESEPVGDRDGVSNDDGKVDRSGANRSHAITWSAGAIRNRFMRLPAGLRRCLSVNRPLHLTLPDGQTVATRLADNGMIHWRGWGPLLAKFVVTPGDIARVDMLEPQRLRVRFEKAPSNRAISTTARRHSEAGQP